MYTRHLFLISHFRHKEIDAHESTIDLVRRFPCVRYTSAICSLCCGVRRPTDILCP